MKKYRVVAWIAVSSEKQAEGSSPEDQRADIRHFVEYTMPTMYSATGEIVRELELADTRSIIELSDAAKIYPESYGVLESMIKAEPPAFDILACRTTDRLGRKRARIATIEELCENRITIVGVAEGLPSTLDCSDVLGSSHARAARGADAREEVKRIMERRDRGTRTNRIAKKKLFPGNPPYGYSYSYDEATSDNRRPAPKIKLDPVIKATLRHIFIDLYMGRGLGVPKIVQSLNKGIYPAPGSASEWTPSAVRVILARLDRYAGWIEWNKKPKVNAERRARQAGADAANVLNRKIYTRVRGDYETVFTDDEVEAIKSEMASRVTVIIRKRRLLTGVCICTLCNSKMSYTIATRTQKSGRIVREVDLRCSRIGCGVSCREDKIIEKISEAILFIESLADPTILLSATNEQTPHTENQIAALEIERSRIGKERERLITMFKRDVLSDEEFSKHMADTVSRLARVDTAIEQAKTDMAKEKVKQSNADRVLDIKARGRLLFDSWPEQPEVVNRWLLANFRVYIQPGKKTAERIKEVRLLR